MLLPTFMSNMSHTMDAITISYRYKKWNGLSHEQVQTRLMNCFDEREDTIMKKIIYSKLVIEIDIDGKYTKFAFSFKQFIWSCSSSIQNSKDYVKTLRLHVLSIDFKHCRFHI